MGKTTVNIGVKDLAKKLVERAYEEKIEFWELIEILKIEWDSQSVIGSKEEIVFRLKAEKFFKEVEENEEYFYCEVEVACSAYKLYKSGEPINKGTVEKETIKNVKIFFRYKEDVRYILSKLFNIRLDEIYDLYNKKGSPNKYEQIMNLYPYKITKSTRLLILIISQIENEKL